MDGLVNEVRSASPTIRGFLYQAIETAIRWSELAPNSALVCEGIEDLDEHTDTGNVYTQYKDITTRLTSGRREFREAVLNFAEAFVSLNLKGGRQGQYQFFSTADKGAPKSGPDLLALWSNPSSQNVKRIWAQLRRISFSGKNEAKLAKRWNAVVSWLHQESRGEQFVRSVDWKLGQQDGEARLLHLRTLLEKTHAAQAEVLAEVLVLEVLTRSAKRSVRDRVLDHAGFSTTVARILRSLTTQDGLAEHEAWKRRRKVDGWLTRLRSSRDSELSMRPGARAIPYVKRPVDDALLDWLSEQHGSSICFVVGSPLTGRSRLAIELVDRAESAGWIAGFVPRTGLDRVPKWAFDVPTADICIIIDDADFVSEPVLAKWVERCAQAQCNRARLIFVTRNRDSVLNLRGLGHAGRSLMESAVVHRTPGRLALADATAVQTGLASVTRVNPSVDLGSGCSMGELVRDLLLFHRDRRPVAMDSWRDLCDRATLVWQQLGLLGSMPRGGKHGGKRRERKGGRLSQIKFQEILITAMLAGTNLAVSMGQGRFDEQDLLDLFNELALTHDGWAVAGGLEAHAEPVEFCLRLMRDSVGDAAKQEVFFRLLADLDDTGALVRLVDEVPASMLPGSLGDLLNHFRLRVDVSTRVLDRALETEKEWMVGPEGLRSTVNVSAGLGKLRGAHSSAIELLDRANRLWEDGVLSGDEHDQISFKSECAARYIDSKARSWAEIRRLCEAIVDPYRSVKLPDLSRDQCTALGPVYHNLGTAEYASGHYQQAAEALSLGVALRARLSSSDRRFYFESELESYAVLCAARWSWKQSLLDDQVDEIESYWKQALGNGFVSATGEFRFLLNTGMTLAASQRSEIATRHVEEYRTFWGSAYSNRVQSVDRRLWEQVHQIVCKPEGAWATRLLPVPIGFISESPDGTLSMGWTTL